MNQLFKFNESTVRVVMKNNEPWFIAKDVCDILEIANSRDAVNRLEENEKGVFSTDTPGGMQSMIAVNESGLYELIFGSRKKESRDFKNWVKRDVLPSIRKTGSYSVQHRIPQTLSEALRLAADLSDQNETLLLENAELKVKTKYVDQILKSKGTVTITQIAKDYGMSGPQLNKILHEDGVQYKQNKQWLLYRKHQDEGYTKSETIDIVRTNGDPDVTLNTRWTQKGRLFIHELLSKRNIVPYMERQPA